MDKSQKAQPCVGLSTQFGNPINPSNPPKPESATARTDHFDGRWQVVIHKTRPLRVSWLVSSPKPEPLDLIIKPKTSDDIWRFFVENLQKPEIFGVLQRRITWNPTRSDEIQLRDLVFIWSDLDGSGQISVKSWQIWPNNGYRRLNLKLIGTTRNLMRPELDDPTSISGRFQVLFSPTRKFRVKSRSSTNPTHGKP